MPSLYANSIHIVFAKQSSVEVLSKIKPDQFNVQTLPGEGMRAGGLGLSDYTSHGLLSSVDKRTDAEIEPQGTEKSIGVTVSLERAGTRPSGSSDARATNS
jgi:hypothetical protein